MRLDQHLTVLAGLKSRTIAKKLIDAGLVRVNRKIITKASLTVSNADTIEWQDFPVQEVPKTTTAAVKLPVLFEDDHCMVIQKPAGLTVHAGSGMSAGEQTVLSSLQPLFAERHIPFSESEALVHRLDKDTTGCLLIAKTPKAHLALQKQFANRSVEKRYLTIVAGIPSPAAAVIDAPIGRHTNKRTKMSVHQAVAVRSARTTYRTLATNNNAALLECELHTGRTHQIRVHLRSIEHPVLGDNSYGTNTSNQLSEKFGITSLCLHAWKLEFMSPSGAKIAVECDVPKKFMDVLASLEITF